MKPHNGIGYASLYIENRGFDIVEFGERVSWLKPSMPIRGRRVGVVVFGGQVAPESLSMACEKETERRELKQELAGSMLTMAASVRSVALV